MIEAKLHKSLLGKTVDYPLHYDPNVLFALPRKQQIAQFAVDIWNGYELTWLDLAGMPQFAQIVIYIDGNSTNIIESKSMKLYLYSFAQTKLSLEELQKTIIDDLSRATKSVVKIDILTTPAPIVSKFDGVCLDRLDICCETYEVTASLLATEPQIATETLYSDLLTSNCPVTNAPDWASVQISYTGPKIVKEGLLQYIVSYRKCAEFHEQCVTKIFADIMEKCQPRHLLVQARYTRRGGLDINPVRASYKANLDNRRLFRQ